MIIEDSVYDAYLSSTKDIYFPLNDSGADPSGKPLPNVSVEMRKKATDRG
jgi:hypothetical protein